MLIKIKPCAKPRMATEKEIELLLCEWLEWQGFFVFKLKDQTAFRNGSYRKPRPFEIAGVADLYAIRKGKAFWIEVKSKNGKQSPAQKTFEENIINQGGAYILARSAEDLKYKLEAYLQNGH
jgi:hypothetical protein